MSLVVLEKIMKQLDGQVILKNIDLKIEANSQIGVKMTHKEGVALFDLITEETTPTSGDLHVNDTGLVLSERAEDQLYDDLTVKAYLKFFQQISGSHADLDKLKPYFSLQDIWKTKIKYLNANQEERIGLLRMFLFMPKLILIESPLRNLTDEGIELYLKALNYIRSQNVTALCTSYYTEELILLSETVYRYSQNNGLEKTDLKQDSDLAEDCAGPVKLTLLLFK